MIRLAEDTIDKKEMDNLAEWLKTYPRLTKGNLTIELESEFSKYLGVKYSVFVNSGSVANLAMLHTLKEIGKLKEGDVVVVPGVSWATDLAPVMQLNLTPVLCDCNLNDLSIDIEHFENIIESYHPKALLLVSVLGLVPDVDKIVRLCKQNNVILLEDICESLGSEYKNKKLGSFGTMGTCSTYFGHHISTIEGGFVFTNDKELYNVLKSIRSHGWCRDLDQEEQQELIGTWDIDEFSSLFSFFYSGFNCRSTDLQAFIGLGQILKLDSIVKKRAANFIQYQNLLKSSLWKPKIYEDRLISSFAYPVIAENRLELSKKLQSASIETRPLICGSLGRQPFYVKKYGAAKLKNADKIHKYGLYVPNHPNLSLGNIKAICEIINEGVV